jgi:hypothetical protein
MSPFSQAFSPSDLNSKFIGTDLNRLAFQRFVTLKHHFINSLLSMF